MKHIYIVVSILFLSISTYSQVYEFGIVHNGGANFSIIATPDFDATDTDVSDIGFTLMLPAGNADVTNMSQFNTRAWSATQLDAETLTNLSLGDGTRDSFVMNLPPGQTILSHTAGNAFVLVMFDISNAPTSGLLEILTNTDPIAIGLSGALDSFYNSNIDSSTTQNYFGAITAGIGSFSFSTLGVENQSILETSISLYPNPTTNFVNIKVLDNELTKVEIYSINGQHIITKKENMERVDMSSFNTGVYFIKLFTPTNSKTIKIIKH
jgi:hypothetical protein